MRKLLNYGLLIAALSLLLTSCNNISKKSIKETAYNWLDTSNQLSIIDWKNANVKSVKFDKQHLIANSIESSINIQNKDTYQVVFTTNYDILGPIVVYLDKNTHEVLGLDYRD